jgi:hypothetical protein
MGRRAIVGGLIATGLMLVASVDCTGQCSPTLSYHLPYVQDVSISMPDGGTVTTTQEGVVVTGYDQQDCWVTFSHGNLAAELHLPALPNDPYASLPPSGDACLNYHYQDQQECEVIQGPRPSSCARSHGCVRASFDGGFGEALFQYLGSTTYDVRVLCGKDFILQQSGLDAHSQMCAL